MPTTYPAWLLTLLNYVERLFWTFVFAFATFASTQTTLGIDTAKAAAMAGIAAVLNLILALLTDWSFPTTLPISVLSMLRIFRTAIASVLALLLTAPQLDLSVNGWKTALIGAAPAIITAVKVLAAQAVGGDTPALLPAKADMLVQANADPTLTFGA
jgi:hypothetical protein